MEDSKPTPTLVTLTSPTAAGKSFLFNYIRDEVKMPCLIGTTTRAPRVGEKDGVDYHFITEEQSKQYEAERKFVELVTYNGVRYGVTKPEFESKLTGGLAFLIVEPNGIPRYTEIAAGYGARHYKVFIHTPLEVRLKRFRERAEADMEAAITDSFDTNRKTIKTFNTYMNRLTTMLTDEMRWESIVKYDLSIWGERPPEENLNIILDEVTNA